MPDNTDSLKHMSSYEAVLFSRLISGIRSIDIAKKTGWDYRCVMKYQHPDTVAAVEMSINDVSDWCRAVGNNIVPMWIAQQCGGVFVKVEASSDFENPQPCGKAAPVAPGMKERDNK